MVNFVAHQGGIIEIDDPSLIPVILLPEIRAVIWRREANPQVEDATEIFCRRSFNEISGLTESMPETLTNRGFDKRQIMIEQDKQKLFPELKPVFRDRLKIKETFESILRTQFHLNQMQVQPAQRFTPDYIAHQDRGTAHGKKFTAQYQKIIATLAHTKDGTIFIPREDAGKPTPDPTNSRRFYHHPLTMKNAIQAGTHDVAITKTGPFEGAVHRTPYTRGGLRLLSFFISEHSYLKIRKNPDLGL